MSVIINFHNELLSLLLRSIISVLRSIPKKNFHELILIDDGSNLDQHCKGNKILSSLYIKISILWCDCMYSI